MHVRTKTIATKGRQYVYTQIVQSHRNARGVPTHRVLANFRDLPELAVENLKAALAGLRTGERVVVADESLKRLANRPVLSNLAYLDVAAALAMWRRWGLSEILAPILPGPAGEMAATDVVAALTVHRCIAPDSKTAGVRWYPRTALPELQGYAPEQFNNSRVHRVLGQLEKAEGALQAHLAGVMCSREGAFVTLFLDITDTWFEGRGPELASEARTKEGLMKRKIGIALMCDQRGFPVRWKTLGGQYFEATEMEQMVREVSGLDWVGDAPVVLDRAMGRAGSVEFLAFSGIRFITAVTVDEFGSYTDRIPFTALHGMKLAGTDGAKEQDVARLRREASRAGMKEAVGGRYVLDIGIMERSSDSRKGHRPPLPGYRIREALELALSIQEGYRQGLPTKQVGKANDIHAGQVRTYRRLLRIAEPLRTRVLSGELDGAKFGELLRLSAVPEPQQAAAFEELKRLAATRPPSRPFPSRRNRHKVPIAPPYRLRGVVAFNPEQFLTQRRKAAEKLREFEAFVDDLNRRLCSPCSRRTRESVLGEVGEQLRRRTLSSVYNVRVNPGQNGAKMCHRVEAEFIPAAWEERRKYDGFVLLVAHESIPATAAEIVETYFAKDKVEKGFKTIKSELDIHPVNHRTDVKVRAHVTLCILALLLERTVEHRLSQTSLSWTAPKVFETLSTCCLNRLQEAWGRPYTITRTTPEQAELLRALNLMELDDDAALRAKLTPR